jgi:two-component system sensor histidine kinase and response regulator WspE
MSLAGESLVQARWLQPFSTALQKLKKHQDRLAGLLDQLADAAKVGRPEQRDAALAEARRQLAAVTAALAERIHEFDDHAARAEDLNSRLYREVIVSRMRPFADGAHGFPRLVRDMARKLGKQVRLEILGLTTEVDRDILEKLEAPLTHLLRNAVDHGIEPPDVRRGAGKPEEGVLRLEVRHSAGMLAITVRDDGAGIDLERLRRKVVERGLTTAEMAGGLSEPELLEFLFLPGFSTARELTEYSGRGVGLDVVQDTVRKVGGSARVRTRLGAGTSFHLQLPITLSVLRAVLVDIAGEPYAFPHNRIDRLLRVKRSSIRSLEHRQFVSVDGQNVGLVLAAQLLDLPAEPPQDDELPVVLLSDGAGQYGLIVEAFQGEQDLVVRPLDPRLGKVPNVSAAAILDDGAPVLIADVEDLVRSMDHFIQSGSLRRCDAAASEKRRKRVLVVDDSITVREVERQLLRNEGHEVDVAVDGRDGWNQVRGGGYDLVVTDVDMPRMTGLDLLKAIRDHESLRGLPVVVVSYKDREEDRQRGLELGANVYLTKSSFHDDRFLQVVRDLIGD